MSIVDDDASMRDAMSFVLRTNGLRAVAFDSAVAFLQGAALQRWACIIVDLRMPGMSGLDLLRRLPEAMRQVPPVILVSAHLDRGSELAALGTGAVACIRKPFSDETLLDAVQRALQAQY